MIHQLGLGIAKANWADLVKPVIGDLEPETWKSATVLPFVVLIRRLSKNAPQFVDYKVI